MRRLAKSTPRNVQSGTDALGFFRKAKNISGRSGGIKARGPVKGGR